VSDTTHTVVDSPVGPLTLVASEAGLREVRFGGAGMVATGANGRPVAEPDGTAAPPWSGSAEAAGHPVLARAVAAIEAYFAGDPEAFADLPLDLSGQTEFRRAVLGVLAAIPRGGLVTYGEVARTLGCGSPRAVGQAVGANPLPVVLPCHRVVAAGRRLGGFSGGLDRKVGLLAIEGGVVCDGIVRFED
jgi:methylated-DNA-[protein]-cysteine S-methyltransferase